MEIRFLSRNTHKIKETTNILKQANIQVIPFKEKIEELQTTDTKVLVKDKILKAFYKIGRPLFVEHTGLYIKTFSKLPGGLTQIFWDSLQAEKFAKFYGNSNAEAVTIIGYCDGKNIKFFEGKTKGKICKKPSGDRSFQWDCVFMPDGYDKTFAELGDLKNEISMRKLALDRFSNYLKKE